MQAMKSEIKENVWGTNRDRKETGIHINGVEQKEETFNQNGMTKQEFIKNERPRNLQDIFKCSNT